MSPFQPRSPVGRRHGTMLAVGPPALSLTECGSDDEPAEMSGGGDEGRSQRSRTSSAMSSRAS